MSTSSDTVRASLRARADVPDADIDDVIAIAQELQDADDAAARGASVAQVQDVARELDIDPRYVEQALSELTRRREADTKARQEAAAQQKRLVTVVGASLAAFLVVAVLWVGSAVPGLRSRATDMHAAEAQLETVVDRQASLAPQLVALAEGDATQLQAKVDAVHDAPDLDAKLEASDALATAMAQQLAALKPTDEASQQVRLNLQYEITGTANRISTERQRYERARVAYEAAASGLRASVARTVGLVD